MRAHRCGIVGAAVDGVPSVANVECVEAIVVSIEGAVGKGIGWSGAARARACRRQLRGLKQVRNQAL